MNKKLYQNYVNENKEFKNKIFLLKQQNLNIENCFKDFENSKLELTKNDMLKMTETYHDNINDIDIYNTYIQENFNKISQLQ